MSGIFDPGIFDSGIFDTPQNARTVDDSLSSLSESPTRVATYARTVSDSISSISESVSWAYPRTVADSISTVTESISRVATNVRSVADSLASLTEAVTKSAAHPRTAADSLSSITEAVVATVFTIINRTVADSLSSISETVTRVKTLTRTLADSLSSISDAVTRVGTTARQIVDVIAGIFEAVFSSGAPATPPSPPAPATFDLTVAGVSILYDPVMYEKAHFESQVNGVAGSCTFRVRDDDLSHSFTEGQEIVLTINSQTAWRGFITAVKRVYAFDAINVAQFGITRFFDIEGADINTLLTKRIVFDQSDGAHVEAPLLAPYTPDLTAIQELFADWLDLTGDGLDTTTLVQNVADTTWSQEGRAWEGSDTWGQAMQSIASLPAAIYYINPDKKFVYTDVDTANAPFKLSDQPDGVSSFGYSNMEILKDGTSLANDVMCWGIGYGSQTPVFERVEDATSQAAHGLWQLGQTTFGVYKQDTITRIADSIVYGSPQNKRGAKDDRISVQCVTYQNGLRAGEKVDFTSNVFGFNDVIPIRKLEIDFPTQFQPRYTLTLSHEIDTPFSFFDNYWFNYNFNFPKVNPRPPVFTYPGACVCGITDTWTRTVAYNSWGTSDAGLPWNVTNPSFDEGGYVDGSSGVLQNSSTPHGFSGNQYFGTQVRLDTVETVGSRDVYIEFRTDHALHVGGAFPDESQFIRITISGGGTNGSPLRVTIWGDEFTVGDSFGETPFTFVSQLSTGTYAVRIHSEDVAGQTVTSAKVWNVTDPEPVSWQATYDSVDFFSNPVSDQPYDLFALDLKYTISPYDTPNKVYWDNFQLDDLTRCTAVQFDNFNRTVASGWGTATPLGWIWTTGITGSASASVNGSSGLMTMSSSGTSVVETTQTTQRVTNVSPGLWVAPAWTFTTMFRFTGALITRAEIEVFNVPRTHTYEVLMKPFAGTVGTTDVDQVSFAFSLGTDYIVKWEFAYGLTHRFKIWAATSAEPSSWTVEAAAPVSLTGTEVMSFGFRGTRSNIGTPVWAIDSADFDYAGRPCYPGGPPVGSGVSANAWVCQQFSGTATLLTLAHSFLPNSPQVWVDGLLQAQSTYTQNATAGTITLGSAPASKATVCYWSLT